MLKACGILYVGVQIVMGLWISNLNRESVQLTTEGKLFSVAINFSEAKVSAGAGAAIFGF
jgi:hypothetical protein